MEKQTIKEIGKLFIDFAKIIFAIAILIPWVKGDIGNLVEIVPVAIFLAIFGIFLINIGERK